MADKVKTAIFGKDLRVELKKYPLSENGDKIDIVSDLEKGYFMPEIGPNTFLDWPKRKKYIIRGPRTYERIYFSISQSSKCVDFVTGNIYGPDREQIKQANLNFLAQQIGSDRNKGTPWYIWPILIFSFLTFFLVLLTSGALK